MNGTLIHPDAHTRHVSFFLEFFSLKIPTSHIKVHSTSYLFLGSILSSLLHDYKILTDLIVYTSWWKMDELQIPQLGGGELGGGADGNRCLFRNLVWSCDSQLKPFNVIFLSMTWEALLDWDLVYFPTWFSAVFHAHVMSQPYTDSGPSSFMDQYLYAQCLPCPPLSFSCFLDHLGLN